MDTNVYFSVDKLQICLRFPKEVFQTLYSHGSAEYNFFNLSCTCHNNANLVFDVHNWSRACPRGCGRMAVLRFNLSQYDPDAPEQYGWLAFDNRYLYAYNHQSLLEVDIKAFCRTFSATLNNITKLELACDITANATDLVYGLIKDTDKGLIILGKNVKDETAPLYQVPHYVIESRIAEVDRSIYIKNKSSNFEFCTYNKKAQIASEGKEYIYDYYKIDRETYEKDDFLFYRMECRLDKDHLEAYIGSLKTNWDDFLFSLVLGLNTSRNLWKWISKKFIRIRVSARRVCDILSPELSGLTFFYHDFSSPIVDPDLLSNNIGGANTTVTSKRVVSDLKKSIEKSPDKKKRWDEYVESVCRSTTSSPNTTLVEKLRSFFTP